VYQSEQRPPSIASGSFAGHPSGACSTEHVTNSMLPHDDDPVRRSVRAALNGLRNLSVQTAAAGRAMMAEPTASHPLGAANEQVGGSSDGDAQSPGSGHRLEGHDFGAPKQRAGGDHSSIASERSSGVAGTSGRNLDQDWLHVGADSPQRRGHALHDSRLLQFKQELDRGGAIDMRNVRALAFDGIPDGEGVRPVIWKVCLMR